jgi:hypothetical protein
MRIEALTACLARHQLLEYLLCKHKVDHVAVRSSSLFHSELASLCFFAAADHLSRICPIDEHATDHTQCYHLTLFYILIFGESFSESSKTGNDSCSDGGHSLCVCCP